MGNILYHVVNRKVCLSVYFLAAHSSYSCLWCIFKCLWRFGVLPHDVVIAPWQAFAQNLPLLHICHLKPKILLQKCCFSSGLNCPTLLLAQARPFLSTMNVLVSLGFMRWMLVDICAVDLGHFSTHLWKKTQNEYDFYFRITGHLREKAPPTSQLTL